MCLDLLDPHPDELLHKDGGVVRVLDDRSLNGVFVNGERIDMREVEDGDELTVGRFRLYFMSVSGGSREEAGARTPTALA